MALRHAVLAVDGKARFRSSARSASMATGGDLLARAMLRNHPLARAPGGGWGWFAPGWSSSSPRPNRRVHRHRGGARDAAAEFTEQRLKPSALRSDLAVKLQSLDAGIQRLFAAR